MNVEKGLSYEKIEQMLLPLSKLRIGVVGDGCLDVYWKADMKLSELSRETPHYPLPVVEERTSLGAAGNVAANLSDLGIGQVFFCTVIGNDWRGRELRNHLAMKQIDESHMVVDSDWITPAYCKPIRSGISPVEYEDPRIDFANRKTLSFDQEERLIAQIQQLAAKVDAFIVTDQFQCGVITPRIRNLLIQLAREGLRIAVDSRDRINNFKEMILKPNELETLKAVNYQSNTNEVTMEEYIESARILARTQYSQVCMTLGEKGAVWIDQDQVTIVPSQSVSGPIDIVGAGDCFMSSFVSMLAAGFTGAESIAFAHIGASVVVKKIGMTGTANPSEILKRGLELEVQTN